MCILCILYISTLTHNNTRYFLSYIDYTYIQIQKGVYTRATDYKTVLIGTSLRHITECIKNNGFKR